MFRCIAILLCLVGLSAVKATYGYSHDENVPESNVSGDVTKTHAEHHGVKRSLGFSNFLEGWFTSWQAYEETKDDAPRVPLLRIAPAFFQREVRFNYIYIDDEHHGEADVNEFAFALELPLTLRFKVDIESKVLHVNTIEDSDNVGFGDTRIALRAMLFENNTLSLSTGSIINIPTGDADRGLGEEITTLGQQLAGWIDLGHRISLHTFLGVEVPTGGNDKDNADLEFLYGAAISKTITVHGNRVLHGITPFLELNGHKGFGLNEGRQYFTDLLPGVRFDLSHELYVLAGYELPLNGSDEFDKRVWFSVIKDF
ncbi:MAG: transporter [Candidatus Brocadia sp.]|nr:MAG: transporter [Candidatus Brocadia sp.]